MKKIFLTLALSLTVFADFGQDNLRILPVRFNSLDVQRLAENKIKLTFTVAEAESVKKFNVKLSLDGKTFTTVSVVMPKHVDPNATYTVTFTF